MIKVDFHCHSEYSADSRLRVKDLLSSARKNGLDRVVVADHNEIEGAMRARELDPELVIIGEEIMTTQGELLALFLTRKVPGGLSPENAIAELRSQGAFISVSHPFDWSRKGSWQLEALQRITPLVDAVEIFNSRSVSNQANRRAADFARENNIPGTAGSDAHAGFELGRAGLNLPEFTDSSSLKTALASAELAARMSPYWVHLVSRWAKWSNMRRKS